MAVMVKQASKLSFGEQSDRGTIAPTRNKWMGPQNGPISFPLPEYAIKQYRGGSGSAEASRQVVKEGKLEGSLPIVLQHGWPIYWMMGQVTDVGGGAPYTHQIRGGNHPVVATVHQELGGDDGSLTPVDYLDSMVNRATVQVPENGELSAKIDYAAQSFDLTGGAQTITEVDRDPYLWDTATWEFQNAGAGTPLGGLTQPTTLVDWEWTLNRNLRQLRGHRNTNARFPVRQVWGSRIHELRVKVVPYPDNTLIAKLLRDRVKFDFTYRLTRGANDYIDFKFRDCFCKNAKHDWPEADEEIPVDLQIQPRRVDVDVVDSFPTLLAAA